MNAHVTIPAAAKPLPLAQWDREVAPYLRAVEAIGKSLTRSTADLQRVMPALRLRTAFMSLAEDALEEAERNLVAALLEVRRSRAAYAALPIDGA
jgi:hypothetical protein